MKTEQLIFCKSIKSPSIGEGYVSLLYNGFILVLMSTLIWHHTIIINNFIPGAWQTVKPQEWPQALYIHFILNLGKEKTEIIHNNHKMINLLCI